MTPPTDSPLAPPQASPVAPLQLRRGMVVELANPRGSGWPMRRLAVVLQADRWLDHHPTLTCCPLTTRFVAAPLLRIPLRPSTTNGLPAPEPGPRPAPGPEPGPAVVQVMVDKLFTAARQQVRRVLGTLEGPELARVELALRQWLELA